MYKVIVVKKPDKGVIIINPNPKLYGDGKKDYKECKGLQKYINSSHPDYVGTVHEYFIMDRSKLPDKSKLESRCQLYHEGNEVKVDTNWDKRRMPAHALNRREILKLKKELEEEVNKEDYSKVTFLKAKIDILRKNARS